MQGMDILSLCLGPFILFTILFLIYLYVRIRHLEMDIRKEFQYILNRIQKLQNQLEVLSKSEMPQPLEPKEAIPEHEIVEKEDLEKTIEEERNLEEADTEPGLTLDESLEKFDRPLQPPSPPPPQETAPEQRITPPQPPPVKQEASLEGVGIKILLWIGALFVGLAIIYLVRYWIEKGLIGPAVRVGIGYGSSLIFLIIGERLRKNSRGTASALVSSSVIGLYASTWAGYRLYGFFSPSLAFVLLAGVSLLGLLESLRYGQMVHFIGLIGGLLTPFWVGFNVLTFRDISVYILILEAGVLLIERKKTWIFPTIILFSGLTMWVGIELTTRTLSEKDLMWILLLPAGSILFVFIDTLTEKQTGRVLFKGLILSFLLALTVPIFARLSMTLNDWWGFFILTIPIFILSRWKEELHFLPWLSGIITFAVYFPWALYSRCTYDELNIVTGISVILYVLSPFPINFRRKRVSTVLLSICSSFILLKIYFLALMKHNFPFPTSRATATGLLILFYMGWFFIVLKVKQYSLNKNVQTLQLNFLVFVIGFYLNQWTDFYFDNHFFTLILFLLLAIYIAGFKRTNWEGFSVLVWFTTTWVGIRIFFLPERFFPEDADLWSHVIRLIIIYGTAVLFFIAHRNTLPQKTFQWVYALAGYGSSFIGSYLIVHTIYKMGFQTLPDRGYWEFGSYSFLTLILFTLWALIGKRIELSWITETSKILFTLSVAYIFTVNTFVANPLFVRIATGHSHLWNTLILHNLLPALFILGVAFKLQHLFSKGLRNFFKSVAIVWVFISLNLLIRHFYHGSVLYRAPNEWTPPIERLTYSGFWLIYGFFFFTIGILRNHRWSRIFALGLFFLTALKVLWLDLPGVTNSYRALAFFGTGVSFIIIAYLFQKYGRELHTDTDDSINKDS